MKRKNSPSSAPANPEVGRSIVVGLVFACVLGALGYWLFRGPAHPEKGAAPTTASPSAVVDYSPLFGRWQREDGDYILEIRSAGADGTLDAYYFNPSPIKVGKAMGMIDSGKLTALVELRDVNYPGSTYRLRHTGTKLSGEYFQATQGETFPVEFSRLP